jgi:SAM-dependent methyltransferase
VSAPSPDETFPDYRPAPNIRDHTDVYELENEALDPDGLVLDAMRRLAPWAGRRLVDLGCGTGFWLPRYAGEAASVVGIEPEPRLRRLAERRVGGVAGVTVLAGSAESIPLPDESVDVVHARFAYFFGPGAERGVTEALRVLRPGGALVMVDNDFGRGEFAELLAAGPVATGALDPSATARWWSARGAVRVDVMSEWRFRRPADLAAVLRIEFPRRIADEWLRRHPRSTRISYGYSLFAIRKGG